MRMNFNLYLLNEQRGYLGQKVGDILTAVQNLHDDAATPEFQPTFVPIAQPGLPLDSVFQ